MSTSTNPTSRVAMERYDRNKAGESIAEIAEKDKVSEKAVQDSIRNVQLYRSRYTHEAANQAISEIIVEKAQKVGKAIDNGLEAYQEYEITDKRGRKRRVRRPDVSAQMRAVGEYRQLAVVIQPKSAPSTHVNVGVGVSNRVQTGSYSGMEDRLRTIIKKQKETPLLEGSTLVQSVMEIPTGEFEQVEPGENAE
jgi:hypothetical protein